MTRGEYEQIVWDNRLSGITTDHGDLLYDLMCEVYWAGYVDGYTHAIAILKSIGPGLGGCGMDGFMEKNMEKIRRRVEAIREVEKR